MKTNEWWLVADEGKAQYEFSLLMRQPYEDYASWVHASIGQAADEIWRSMKYWGRPDWFIPMFVAAGEP